MVVANALHIQRKHRPSVVALALKQAGLLSPPSSPSSRRRSPSRTSSPSPIRLPEKSRKETVVRQVTYEGSRITSKLGEKEKTYSYGNDAASMDYPYEYSDCRGQFENVPVHYDALCDWDLEPAQTESPLGRLVGTWEDSMGSTYCVVADRETKFSCSVQTTRPDGRFFVTKGLIKMYPRNAGKATPQITWGKGFVLKMLDSQPDELCWIGTADPAKGKSFQWRRIGGRRRSAPNSRSSFTSGAQRNDTSTPRLPFRCKAQQKAIPSSDMEHTNQTSALRPCNPPPYVPEVTSFHLREVRLCDERGVSDIELRLSEEDLALREISADLADVIQGCKGSGAAGGHDQQSAAALSMEVAALIAQRESEKKKLRECRKEKEKMQEKLQRCREVVAITVESVDRMLTEYDAETSVSGQTDADVEARARSYDARCQAEKADAEAAALLSNLDDDNASTSDGADSTASSGGPSSCFNPPRQSKRSGSNSNQLPARFVACKEEMIEAPHAIQTSKILQSKVFGVSASKTEDIEEQKDWWDNEEPVYWNARGWY